MIQLLTNSTIDITSDSIEMEYEKVFSIYLSKTGTGTSELNTDNIPKYSGNIYYVSKNGNDANTGKSPDVALLTIGAAISKLVSGDAINIMSGDYTEVGLDLNIDYCEMWFELGSMLSPASGTAITITGDNCCVCGPLTVNAVADEIGVDATCSGYLLRDINVLGNLSSAGINISGATGELVNCKVTGIKDTEKSFNIVADRTICRGCGSAGTVSIESLYGDVETVLSGDIGNGYLQLYDGTNTVDVTDAPGPSFNSLPVGTYIHKIDDVGVNLRIENSSQVRLYEDATKDGRDPTFTVTAKEGADSFLRFIYSGTGTSGVIHWHCKYRPITEDGFVEVV